MMIKNLFIALFICLSIHVFSQNQLNPVTWIASYIQKSATEGEIVFTATIEKKWHIYSQRPTDAGPIPTSFSIMPSPDFELVGKVEETNAHEEFVPAFDAKAFVFEGSAVFKQKLKLKNKKEFKISTSLEYMTCNDKQCLPPKIVDLQVTVPVQKNN